MMGERQKGNKVYNLGVSTYFIFKTKFKTAEYFLIPNYILTKLHNNQISR